MSFKTFWCKVCLTVLIFAFECHGQKATSCINKDTPDLKFNSDHTFKIVQFTDVHWKAGNNEEKKNNPASIGIMNAVLDAEKPDLVMLTGDIVVTAPARKGWIEVTEPMIRRKIPWAVVLGNHDDEGDMNRKQIIAFLETLPCNMTEAGPVNLSGCGNYILGIKDSRDRDAAVLYCLDSLAYTPIKDVGKYGWIQPDQIQWYRDNSRRIKQANNGRTLPSLAFFHIPLPEYNDVWNQGQCIRAKKEDVCCPAINSGLYSALLECGDVMAVFVGHDHDNDYIGSLYGIHLAYGRASGGKNAYGSLPKGARVIQLKAGQHTFDTWIRTADGDVENPLKQLAQ